MKLYFTLFVLTLILLGCGGGGSSTPIDNPSLTYQEPLETNSTSLKQENEVKIPPPISESNVTNDEKEDATNTLPLASESNSTSDEKGSGALPSPKEFLDLVPLAYAPTGGGDIELPASFDLSSQMPQVGDQGSQNSCVGWAVGYYLKSFHEHNEHQLPYGINADYTHRYSPAFIYNIAKIDSCQSGATLFDALKLLKTTGTPPWEDMPYHQNDCTTTPSKVAIEKAMCGKISNFKRFDTQSVYFLSNLKYFLSRSYPIVVAIELYDDFIYPQKHNNEYFFKELNAQESPTSLSHALLVVGYDESRNAFKIINSWGVHWGNEGYLWIDYEVFGKILIEAFVVEDEIGECEVGGSEVEEVVNPIDDNETLFPAMIKDAFVTRWDTTQSGFTDSNQIKIGVIPFNIGRNYYSVDWGDGTVDSGLSDDAIHTYAQEGVYRVQITGIFSALYFDTDGNYDNNKLLLIEQWGNQEWVTMYKFCLGCKNVNISAKDAPNLSHVGEMSYMFRGATSFNSDISHWDISRVELAYMMFAGATAFNQPIGEWNTSNIDNAYGMFEGAISFNQDLSHWDLQKARDLSYMFQGASSFNQDIGNWNVGNVINMSSMFTGASSFNQDLSRWNVSKVTNMSDMFVNANLSMKNYSKLLEQWSQLDLQQGVSFGVGTTKYLEAYAPFRESIIQSFNWTIKDGGELFGEVIAHNELEYYTVQSPYTHRVWLDRNLGATRVCQSIDDALCFGDYYQWGRGSDGHEKKDSLVTNQQATALEGLDNKFIATTQELEIFNDDWANTIDTNGTLRSINWNKTDGSLLCPVGFRVPSESEIVNETLNQGVQDAQNAFDSFLKIPLAGRRSRGLVFLENTQGCLWTNTHSTSYSTYVHLSYSSFYSYGGNRIEGCSVRCIKEE